MTEQSLRSELENAQSALQLRQSDKSLIESKARVEAEADTDASQADLREKLESKKEELVISLS